MPLVWSRAAASRDAADFEAFNCWDGNAGVPWVEEVENYVRWWVLVDAQYVVAGRDGDGRLAAVAAFDERVIAVPLVAPIDHAGWYLKVVAIRLDLQAGRLFDEAIETTFQTMRDVDPTEFSSPRASTVRTVRVSARALDTISTPSSGSTTTSTSSVKSRLHRAHPTTIPADNRGDH